MRRERTESEGAMQELLWRRTAAFEGEASDLYFQIARLKSVQKAALDAQSLAMRSKQFDERLAAQERQTQARIDSAMERELLKQRGQ